MILQGKHQLCILLLFIIGRNFFEEFLLVATRTIGIHKYSGANQVLFGSVIEGNIQEYVVCGTTFQIVIYTPLVRPSNR